MDGGLMIPVGNHDLACLEAEDYAAVALYMQNEAFAIEAALLSEQTALNEYRLRTSMEFVTVVTTSFASGGGTVMPDGRAANNIDFTGATVLGGGSTVSSLGSSVAVVPARSGWYDVGGFTNAIPAGAITAASERVMYIQVTQVPDLPATNTRTLYQERVTDTNTGGEFLNVSGLVYLIGGRLASIEMLVSHANVASNMVMQIGSKIWLAYYGPKGGIVVNA